MKLEIDIHPVDSERFFVDFDFTIWRVKVENVNVRVMTGGRTEVSHYLEALEIAEQPPRKIFSREGLTWQSSPFGTLFETIEAARVEKAEMIALREARQ